MNYSNATRLLPICLAILLAACGGGGGDSSGNETALPAVPGAAPVAGPDAAWRQTAYLRTDITSRIVGREYGLSGGNARDLIDVCNAVRQGYELPASPAIDAAVMTSLDVRTREQYFDNGLRAATYTSGRLLDLPDLTRWRDEAKTNPKPATPPDCAQHRLVPLANGTVWRDGRRYELNYQKSEAVGQSAVNDFTPQVLVSQTEVDTWPSELYVGQTCKNATAQAPAFSVTSCLWTLMPQQKLLNWPWVLRSEVALSGDGSAAAGALADTTRTLDSRVNNATAADEARLRLPDGFTVIERP